jgi:predicted DNA-binding transcriptional regulator YafY
LANEKFHYVTVSDSSTVKDLLWELGCAIKRHNFLELTYRKQVPDCEIVTRVIEPVGIIFSEYYFYLNAYVVEKRSGKYVQLYDTPTTFRIDRIVQYHERKESFRIPYKDTFHPGEFHNRIQFMFAGELQKVKFRYVGASVDAILDRLPTAQIIREKDHEYIFSAEVYEDGFVRWLLSQGRAVELLEPVSLRGRVRDILSEMTNQYN